MHPAKTQISLGICPVWSESLLCALWVAKDPSFLHADSEDSDQTGRMPSLIWVFAGHRTTLLVLSRGGSVVCLVAVSELPDMLLNFVAEQAGFSQLQRQVISWCGSYKMVDQLDKLMFLSPYAHTSDSLAYVLFISLSTKITKFVSEL